MPWTWADNIDPSTDLQDLSLWNALLIACHERFLASAAGRDTGSTPKVDEDAPELEAGQPDKYDPGAETANPLKGHTARQSQSGRLIDPVWATKGITDMQMVLRDALPSYVNVDLYPNGLDGLGIVAGSTIPADFLFNSYTIGEPLGYPGDQPNTLFIRIFRRRCPRRIHSLTATTSEDYSGYYSYTGVTYWQRATSAVAIGDKAQYYAYSGFTVPGSGQLATVRVPGFYRGIYEYQGSGVWTPCPPGVEADVLDSNEPWNSHTWTSPGPYQPGDYFGWWLLRDIYETCKFLRWTWSDGTTYDAADTQGKLDYKRAAMTYDSTTEAGAHASAESRVAGVTAANRFHSAGGAGQMTLTFGSPGDYGSEAQTSRWKIGVPFAYHGLDRDVDFYLFPRVADQGDCVFEAFGLGFTEDQWSKWTTTTETATAHTYTADKSGLVLNYEVPTVWGAVNVPKGWRVPSPTGTLAPGSYYLAAIIKWQFTNA